MAESEEVTTIESNPCVDVEENVTSNSPVETMSATLARVYDKHLHIMPKDLYIPPDALEIFLESFEGPLDLLLYVIRKQNFDILDIPLAQVTKQFLVYVDQIKLANLELASEYLLMAALLIEIKSRMLLPVFSPVVEEEGEDPRAELVRRLLEYEQIKSAALNINGLPQMGRDVFAPDIEIPKGENAILPTVEVNDLQRAFVDLLRRANLNKNHTIAREELSVREHMTLIMRQLKESKFVEFSDLFTVEGGVPVVVVHFVAMLELAKELMIEITQAEPFAPIYVRSAVSAA